jgi:hypothetical protein
VVQEVRGQTAVWSAPVSGSPSLLLVASLTATGSPAGRDHLHW